MKQRDFPMINLWDWELGLLLKTQPCAAPGTTCTPVLTKMLLRLEPVTDLTSEATVEYRNFKAGLLDLKMALTNLLNLVYSMYFKLHPVISSRIQRWDAHR